MQYKLQQEGLHIFKRMDYYFISTASVL